MFTCQEPTRRLRCDWCGASRQLTADELFDVNRTKWPRCCQCPMILDAADQSAGPDDLTDAEWAGLPMRWMVPGSRAPGETAVG
jgi:hypothetical protein